MPAPVADHLKVRSRDFAIVLYPDEDIKHERVFRYIVNHERLFNPVWIVHDKDFQDDGSPKKSHVHMFCHMPKQTTISGFLKCLSNYIDYAEPVHNDFSYLMYMIHDTLSADSDGKHLYDLSELHGNPKLISKVFGQNPYFVQLGEFAEACRQGANISDIIIDSISIDDVNKRKIAMESFDKYSHVICCMSNQEKNDIKVRNCSSERSDIDYDTKLYYQLKVGENIES